MKNMKKTAVLCWILSALLIVPMLQAQAPDSDPIRVIKSCIEMLEKHSLQVPASLQEMQEKMEKIIRSSKTGHCCVKLEKIAAIGAVTVYEVIEQEWDGSGWQNAWRAEIGVHDTHGFVHFINQEWDGSKWVNSIRMMSTLNAQEQMTGVQVDDWDGSAWIPVSLIQFAYDAQGNLIEEIWQFASEEEDGELQNFMRDVHTYEDGQLTKTEGYFWQEGAWGKTQQTVYTYNPQGLLVEEINSYFIDEQEMIMGRNLYTYSASGLVETKTQQSVDIWTQDWVNETKTTYQYHASGEQTSELYQIWNDGSWENHSLYTAVYNHLAQLIEDISQTWEDEDWLNQERELYAYDGSGNNIVHTEQIWEDGDWQNEYKTTASFDVNGRPLEAISQNWEGGQWVNDVRLLYNYAFGTSVNADETMLPEFIQLGNYPNPFNPSTTIQITLPAQDVLSVRIYDLRGRAVKTLAGRQMMRAGVHTLQWDGTDESGRAVSSGTYVYRVEGEKISAAARCMLIK